MRKLLLFIFLLPLTLYASEVTVKSLRTYAKGDETSFPLIEYSEKRKGFIIIEFDVQADLEPNLKIEFKFCDRNWIPYDNAFLANYGYNTEYSLWFDNLPVTVGGARYHYKGEFPNQNVTFPYSGNWIYNIIDTDTKEVCAAGKFIVVYPLIEPHVLLKKGLIQTQFSDDNERDRIFEFYIDFVLPDSLFPSLVLDARIIENKKIDYPTVIAKDGMTLNREYYWDGNRKYKFIARDVKPGNGYRQTDLRDRKKFTPPFTYATLDRIETSNYGRLLFMDFNGGSRIDRFRDEYSQYMDVGFRLRLDDKFDKQVFITGSFTNWQVLPEYALKNVNGMWNTTVELKRGVYDYQYVTGDIIDGEVTNIDWVEIEGNFLDANHEYIILVYYESNELGGYDQLISLTRIQSGGL